LWILFRVPCPTPDGSAFYAVACWESGEAARTFFERWSIEAEPGEVGIELLGDVGLVPLGQAGDPQRTT